MPDSTKKACRDIGASIVENDNSSTIREKLALGEYIIKYSFSTYFFTWRGEDSGLMLAWALLREMLLPRRRAVGSS